MAPVESVDVVARNLEKRFSATEVSFLFIDLIGQEAIRLPRAGTAGQAYGEAGRCELVGSVYDRSCAASACTRRTGRAGAGFWRR